MTGRDDDRDAGFLSRWSQRKAALRHGPDAPSPGAADVAPATSPPVRQRSTVPGAATPPVPVDPRPVEPPPQMADVEDLTPASDFSRFTRPDVDPAVGNAALKKLFADPRFNVIDEMDIDIMDYGKLEALPPSMLGRMASAHALGLFREGEEGDAAPPDASRRIASAAPTAQPETPVTDENPDLRLQPDDAAGLDGDRPGPEGDAGGQR
ncbi:MAG: DUF3306 domain-containing protein [Rubrivivax sp.]|nr:DUF3306 domain-containing protein [Rubrivivax sp.]